MSKEDKEIEKLDKEFDDVVKVLERYMTLYTYREKYLVTEWITKLKQSKSSIEERKLRTRFIKHFVSMQEEGVNLFSSDPFNKIPSNFGGPLIGLKKLLPKEPNEALNPSDDEKRSYISKLFDSLVDNGAFLAQQPVPRSGTFFIIIEKAEDSKSKCPLIKQN